MGLLPFSKNLGRPERTAALEVILQALAEAGIGADEVDGVVRTTLESTTDAHIDAAATTSLRIGDTRSDGNVLCSRQAVTANVTRHRATDATRAVDIMTFLALSGNTTIPTLSAHATCCARATPSR